MSGPECCPPTALPYLKSDYVEQGNIVAFNDANYNMMHEIYEAPVPEGHEPKSAIMMCPDVWGWARLAVS